MSPIPEGEGSSGLVAREQIGAGAPPRPKAPMTQGRLVEGVPEITSRMEHNLQSVSQLYGRLLNLVERLRGPRPVEAGEPVPAPTSVSEVVSKTIEITDRSHATMNEIEEMF